MTSVPVPLPIPLPEPLHVIVLAAGQGTRMKSALPKVLHPLGGRPLIAHVLETASALGAAGIHIVHGHGGEQVRAWVDTAFADAPLSWAQQAQQLGTAHAVTQAMPAIPAAAQVLVMYGDVPLTPVDTLRRLVEAGRQTLAVLTVTLDEPAGYGRILRDAQGQLRGIVEDKDADAAQRAIREVNTGMIAAPAAALRGWLARIGNANAKGEFYLTDAVALAVQDGLSVASVTAACAADVEGVNDRVQLAQLERALQRRRAQALMRDGVTLADPARIDVRGSLRCGRDVQIDVGCIFEGEVVLDDGVRIGPYCVLKDVSLGPNSVIEAHSVLDGARIGAQVHIGPFARLRPGTQLADHARVGNFVEIKQSTLGEGSKVNHLSYVGDATVGAQVNVGAGTITCNYDGANKHRTTIGDNAFIGSNTALVAPVTVGDHATIAAGSVIARDAPAGGLTIARAREQKTVPGWKRPVKKK